MPAPSGLSAVARGGFAPPLHTLVHIVFTAGGEDAGNQTLE
jgi:hypothetical protein